MNTLENFITKVNNGGNMTINFVGDSITHGLNHCRAEETYTAKFAMFLARIFKKHTIRRYDGIYLDGEAPMKEFEGPILVALGEEKGTIDVLKNGIGGNTVIRAYNRIDDFTGILANGRRPDITFMMFGINDALKSDPKKYTSPQEFKSNYKMLINEVRRRNPDTFIIMMGATFNDQTIELHCEKSKQLAREEGIPYIDLHELWMKHYDASAENFGQGNWLAGGTDACHPTPTAAEIMAKYIFEAFMKLINE